MKCPECHCTRVDVIRIVRRAKKKFWKFDITNPKKLVGRFEITRYRVLFACQHCQLEYSELVDRDSLHGQQREQFEEHFQWR